MIEALLNVRIPELWVTPISEKYAVSLSCQIGGRSDTAGWGVVTMSGDDALLDTILDEIRRHLSVGGIDLKARQPGSVAFLVDVVRCNACDVLMTSKAFMVYPVDIVKGRMKWLLITDTNKTMGRLVDQLEACGCDVRIDRVTPLDGTGVLTTRQEEVIRIAFVSGYFDYPRRMGSSTLASKIGISASTLSEILRAAQRRIFAEYLRT